MAWLYLPIKSLISVTAALILVYMMLIILAVILVRQMGLFGVSLIGYWSILLVLLYNASLTFTSATLVHSLTIPLQKFI